MKGEARELDLLDRLYRWVGCDYLSDLRTLSRSSQSWFRLVRALEEVGPEEYSLSVWEDAYQYLTGETGRFTSAREGKQQLLRRLR